jgi:addiction module RelE/StbE family toxin
MEIRWMPLAAQDLEAVYDYVQQDSENAAKQLTARIFSAVGMLTPHPLAGREGRAQGTRKLAVARTPRVIAYHIRQDGIQILAVLHGAQRWPTPSSG